MIVTCYIIPVTVEINGERVVIYWSHLEKWTNEQIRTDLEERGYKILDFGFLKEHSWNTDTGLAK